MDEQEFADLGLISEKLDPQSAFALQIKYRTACRKAFCDADCSERVARSILRKSAPIPGDYATEIWYHFVESRAPILLRNCGRVRRD